MTITLCIETSGPYCSLALAVNEQIYAHQRVLHRSHNLHLLAMLDTLFERAKITPAQVELVAFGCGPGSFTGVRIAAATTQAIATVADARVLPVASSLVLALSGMESGVQAQRGKQIWVSCVPSRGQASYMAAYSVGDNRPDEESAALELLHADELVESPPAWLMEKFRLASADGVAIGLLGTAPTWLPVSMQSIIVAEVTPSAQAMIDFARDRYAKGASLAVDQALPKYVVGDSPWLKQTGHRVKS